MTNSKLIIVSIAVMLLFPLGFLTVGFDENATVGLLFWSAAIGGGAFLIYAAKKLPGTLKFIPLAPFVLFALGTIAAILYFMTF